MRWKQLPLLLLMSFAATAAYADSTIYNVNVNVGAANATGTITTDGALGVLTTNDILGFSLTLTSGTNTSSLVNQSAGVLGKQFTATTDGLFFDFSNTTSANYAGFADNQGMAQQLLCFTGGGNCGSLGGQSAVIRINGVEYDSRESGSLQIAALPVAAAATPEPSSLALLGTGLLGMYGAARRRFV